jgi:hypothetical protein
METKLGKIEKVEFGVGGYQEAMIGLHVTISGDGWGVCDTTSAWDAETIKHSEHCKWTENDRSKQYDDIVRFVSKLLKQAKVKSISSLKGIPVETIFEGNSLKEWRILEEVL